jgi:hypothetical protein
MPLARSIPGHAFAAAAKASGSGVLAIWHNVAPGYAAAVREWYAREHHFERLALPGFMEARRYDRVSGAGADVLGLYSLSSPDALVSEAVREGLAAPSKWTRTVMPHFRNTSITACGIAAEAGLGEGGHVAALACTAGSLPRAATLCAELLSMPGVLRVRTLVAADAGERARSAEMTLTDRPEGPISWALLADAESAEAAQTALYSARKQGGAAEVAHCAVYRLAFCARKTA